MAEKAFGRPTNEKSLNKENMLKLKSNQSTRQVRAVESEKFNFQRSE